MNEQPGQLDTMEGINACQLTHERNKNNNFAINFIKRLGILSLYHSADIGPISNSGHDGCLTF